MSSGRGARYLTLAGLAAGSAAAAHGGWGELTDPRWAAAATLGAALAAAGLAWTGIVASAARWAAAELEHGRVERLPGRGHRPLTVLEAAVVLVLSQACAHAALLVAGFAMSRRRNVREPAYLEFGLLMLLIPLVSPQGWDYVLLIATPAVMLLVDRWREMTMAWRILTAAALVAIGFTIIDLLGKPIYNWTMRVSLLTICATLLVAALTNLRVRRLA